MSPHGPEGHSGEGGKRGKAEEIAVGGECHAGRMGLGWACFVNSSGGEAGAFFASGQIFSRQFCAMFV
jgi:hypothetical protein